MNETQLAFDLPCRAALGVEDFFVSASNGAAVAWIDRWPDWPAPALLLAGPPGSGKTHLAHIWRAKSSAGRIDARLLSDAPAMDTAARGALAVEDIDRGIGDERALFHILNGAREHGGSVLLTSSRAPGELSVDLPDLRSRLRALPVAVIDAPDEALVRAVLVKLFADRQLTVEPRVVAYLAIHVERSMAAVARLVAALDELSLARKRPVSRSLAAAALGLAAGEPSGAPDQP